MMPVLVPGLTPLARVSIPEGAFEMGSNDFFEMVSNDFSGAQPVTNVTVSAFKISETRATIGAYQEYLRALGDNRWTHAVRNEQTGDFTVMARGTSRSDVQEAYVSSLSKDMSPGARIEAGGFVVFEVTDPELPAEFRESLDQPEGKIDWWDNLAFAAAHGGDLPTGAEYERVQRGKSGKDKYGTVSGKLRAENGKKLAQFEEDRTSPVKRHAANSWDVYDASGNTWVWTKDWYASSYEGRSNKDPRGPGHGKYRVLRGGAYRNDEDYLHAAYRINYDPHVRYKLIGGVVVWRS